MVLFPRCEITLTWKQISLMSIEWELKVDFEHDCGWSGFSLERPCGPLISISALTFAPSPSFKSFFPSSQSNDGTFPARDIWWVLASRMAVQAIFLLQHWGSVAHAQIWCDGWIWMPYSAVPLEFHYIAAVAATGAWSEWSLESKC